MSIKRFTLVTHGDAWERILEAEPLVDHGARYELKPTNKITLKVIVARMIRFEETTDNKFSDLAQGQKETVGLLRQLVQGLNGMDQRLDRMEETQASLIAGQERQERILDYLLRRIDGQDADS